MRFAVAFALIKARKVVRGLREGLTEEERYAVADAVMWRLKEHGDRGSSQRNYPLKAQLPSRNLGCRRKKGDRAGA